MPTTQQRRSQRRNALGGLQGSATQAQGQPIHGIPDARLFRQYGQTGGDWPMDHRGMFGAIPAVPKPGMFDTEAEYKRYADDYINRYPNSASNIAPYGPVNNAGGAVDPSNRFYSQDAVNSAGAVTNQQASPLYGGKPPMAMDAEGAPGGGIRPSPLYGGKPPMTEEQFAAARNQRQNQLQGIQSYRMATPEGFGGPYPMKQYSPAERVGSAMGQFGWALGGVPSFSGIANNISGWQNTLNNLVPKKSTPQSVALAQRQRGMSTKPDPYDVIENPVAPPSPQQPMAPMPPASNTVGQDQYRIVDSGVPEGLTTVQPQASQPQEKPSVSLYTDQGFVNQQAPAPPRGIFDGMVAAPTGGSSLNTPRFTPGTTQSAYRPLQSLQPQIDASRERTRINGEMLRNQARQQVGPLAPVANTEMIPGDPMAPENIAFRQGRPVPDVTGFGSKARVNSGGLLYGLMPGNAARQARGVNNSQLATPRFTPGELQNRAIERNSDLMPVMTKEGNFLKGSIDPETGMARVNPNSMEQLRFKAQEALRNRPVDARQLGNILGRQQELEGRAEMVKLRGLARGFERQGAPPLVALAMGQAAAAGGSKQDIARAGQEAQANAGDPNAIRGLNAATERQLGVARANALGAEAQRNQAIARQNDAMTGLMPEYMNLQRAELGLPPLPVGGEAPVTEQANPVAAPQEPSFAGAPAGPTEAVGMPQGTIDRLSKGTPEEQAIAADMRKRKMEYDAAMGRAKNYGRQFPWAIKYGTAIPQMYRDFMGLR